MTLITVENLKPGMVLAGDLSSPKGQLLAAKGTILEELHIRVCRTYGVRTADIEGDETEENGAIAPELLYASEELARSRFLLADHHQCVTAKLSEIFANLTAREAARGRVAVPLVPDASKMPAPGPLKKLTTSDLQGADEKLPSLPNIFFQLQEAMSHPRSSAHYVGEIISKDSSLTAKLLKLANSAFYGYPQRIDSISRAVTIVGVEQITSLAMGITLVQYFKDLPESLNMKSFWKHSLGCGVIARILAGQCKQNLDQEHFFVAGVLHDLGRLFILKNYPLQAQAALQESLKAQELLVTAENRIWGFNHAFLAGELFHRWNFPASLEMAVRYHHQPLRAISPLEPGLIHLADILAHSFNLGYSGAWYIHPIEEKIWQMLDLPDNILPVLASLTDQQFTEAFRVFF
ncbi:MAG: HDOD domain-containing protein [Desulfobulbaceae bacterium]|nr:HDOD domain-containing protein [Desulfobulbaceae bacterium]